MKDGVCSSFHSAFAILNSPFRRCAPFLRSKVADPELSGESAIRYSEFAIEDPGAPGFAIQPSPILSLLVEDGGPADGQVGHTAADRPARVCSLPVRAQLRARSTRDRGSQPPRASARGSDPAQASSTCFTQPAKHEYQLSGRS